MNSKHFNFKLILTGVILSLMLNSLNATSEPSLTCPQPRDMQNIHLTLGDLKEIRPPHMECCTASGFPYFVDGEWTVNDKLISIDGIHQWRISTRYEYAKTIDLALTGLNKLFVGLPQPWLKNEFGQWYCEYGGKGVTAWLITM